MPRRRRSWSIPVLPCALACVLAGLCAGGSARAEATAEQVAAADALYREGWHLMQQGRPTEACPKLEESQRLDPGMGTLLLIAECYEKTQRPASAWERYLDIADHDQKRSRADEARAHARRLEPRLPRLTVRVPPRIAETAGIRILRDGVELPPARWGAPIPVDLGPHRVRALSPSKEPWETTVEVTRLEQHEVVTVPLLRDALPAAPTPAAPAPAASTPAATTALPATVPPVPAPAPPPDTSAPPAPALPPTSLPTMQKAALGVGGAGLAGLTVGAILGGLAVARWRAVEDAAKAQCANPERFVGCSNRLKADQEEASRFATASTVSLVAGGTAVAVAVGLWLGAAGRSSSRPAMLRVVPALGPHRAGLWMEGLF